MIAAAIDDDKRQNLPLGRRVIDKAETQMVGEALAGWTEIGFGNAVYHRMLALSWFLRSKIGFKAFSFHLNGRTGFIERF